MFFIFRIIHDQGYTKEECIHYRSVVHQNTIQSLIAILKAMTYLKIDFMNPARVEDARKFFNSVDASLEIPITPEIAHIMKRLYRDEGVQKCLSRAREYQLNDSAQ